MHHKRINMVRKIALTSIALFLCSIILNGQDWDIPVPEKNRTSPVAFNQDLVKQGNTLYQANCKSCHGDPGKGNVAKLNPQPVDPITRQFQGHSDGEIFYILKVGRGLMPSFSGPLTEMERWAVIAYTRSFNRSYVQPPLAEIIDLDLTGTLALILTTKPEEHIVQVQLVDTLDGKNTPIQNAQIRLFVKRTFGNLTIGESTSDEQGLATFAFPKDLPGDTIGNLSIIAIAGSEGKEVSATSVELMGIAVNPTPLLSQRSWWNISRMAPIWLIATFMLCILAGVLAVGYVISLLHKIKMYNTPKTK
jgi:mono/diheme cytochrome c family protein